MFTLTPAVAPTDTAAVPGQISCSVSEYPMTREYATALPVLADIAPDAPITLAPPLANPRAWTGVLLKP
jgi:hypothetical protein